MKHFINKVAVITGGASGLGRAIGRRLAKEGVKIMLADVEEQTLNDTVSSFKDEGYDVRGHICDVANRQSVEELAKCTVQHFGSVDLLFNNAGVAPPSGRAWEHSEKEWEWGLGVNVWGVINGISVFTPLMLKQETEGHIVNTASVAGLLSLPQMSLYCVTKHSVVTLSESLYHDLIETNAKISCSVLCPAYVPTQISDSERNRPNHLKDKRVQSKENLEMEEKVKYAVKAGKISAEDVANLVFQGIQKNTFYILSHPRIKPAVETRVKDILLDNSPTNTFSK